MRYQYVCLLECTWFFTVVAFMLVFHRHKSDFKDAGDRMLLTAKQTRSYTDVELAYGYARAYLLVFKGGGLRRV